MKYVLTLLYVMSLIAIAHLQGWAMGLSREHLCQNIIIVGMGATMFLGLATKGNK